MKTLIIGHPFPNLVEVIHNHFEDNYKTEIIQPDILPNSPKDPFESLPKLELKTIEMEPCNYVPMPKKGIGQKAQWANKPHKRKRK